MITTKKKSKRVSLIKKQKKKVLKQLKETKKVLSAEEKAAKILAAAEAELASSATKEEEKKKLKLSKMYFTQDTEDAIIEFNASTDDDRRNELYRTRIQRPFEKLAENIFNTFKFTYFEVGPLDAQKEVVSFLVGNIHKFQPGKGKAFSYFSIVAKHYLILQNNTNYVRFKRHVDINDQPIERKELIIHPSTNNKKEESREFIKLMVRYWESNIDKMFTKKRDLVIANAVIELFRKSDRIDNFNKKALYLYIREIADCRTQHITKIINKLKRNQQAIQAEYRDTGNITV